MLRLHFWIAITLCHELIHAINHATSDNREPFYGNQNYAELGYAWENAVFGGRVLAPRRFDGHFPFTMVKWPSLALTPDDDSDETTRGYAKGSATYYYVPMDHMARIQQQETWDAYGSPDRAPLDTLHIPKRVGVQLHDPAQETVDPLWRRSESSEGRWPGRGRHARVWRVAYLRKLVLHGNNTTATVDSSGPSPPPPLLGRMPTSPDRVTDASRGRARRKGRKVVVMIDPVERFMRYLDKEEMR